jgi:hypothetical protein
MDGLGPLRSWLPPLSHYHGLNPARIYRPAVVNHQNYSSKLVIHREIPESNIICGCYNKRDTSTVIRSSLAVLSDLIQTGRKYNPRGAASEFSPSFSLQMLCRSTIRCLKNLSRPFFFLPTQKPSLLPTPILQYGNTARRVSFSCLITGHLAFPWFRSSTGSALGVGTSSQSGRNQLKITVTFMRLPVWMNYPLEPSPKFQSNLLRRVDGGLMPGVETESLNRGDQTSAGLG